MSRMNSMATCKTLDSLALDDWGAQRCAAAAIRSASPGCFSGSDSTGRVGIAFQAEANRAMRGPPAKRLL
jgi:hypothetical protein